MDGELDIGGGHKITQSVLEWDPEHVALNPWLEPLVAEFGPGPHPYGLTDFHDDKQHPGHRHGGGITYNTEIVRAYHTASEVHSLSLGHPIYKHPTWELVSLDPIHVEPSLLCGCGSHGFIRHGAWEECG